MDSTPPHIPHRYSLPDFPERCYTCHTPIGHLLEKYEDKRIRGIQKGDNGKTEIQILDDLGIIKPCCRRHFLTHKSNDAHLKMYGISGFRVERYTDDGVLEVEDWTAQAKRLEEKTKRK